MPLEFGNELKLQSAHALTRLVQKLRQEIPFVRPAAQDAFRKTVLGTARVASLLKQSAHSPALDGVHTLEVARIGVTKRDTHEEYRAKDHKDKESV